MSGIIGIIALLGGAFIINYLIGSVGEGFVEIFKKMGFGKVGSMIFGGCIFIAFITILNNIVHGYM